MRPLMEKSAGSTSAKKSGKDDSGTAGFEMLRAVLKRKSDEKKASDGSRDSEGKDCSANLETVVEEGIVKKIIVHCSCGEVIEIDCDYGG